MIFQILWLLIYVQFSQFLNRYNKKYYPLNIMTPDFSMNFLYSLYQNDTLDGIPKISIRKSILKWTTIHFLQVKDLKISVTSKDIYIENGNFTIASLMPKSSTVIGFDVYTSSTLSKVCKVNITIKMGDWEKVIRTNFTSCIHRKTPILWTIQRILYLYKQYGLSWKRPKV